MNALDALHRRTSVNLLDDPAPDRQQIENLIKAGLRACDHDGLTPWKFLLIEGERRKDFGELMVTAKTALDNCPPPIDLATKLRQKALRAPSILVVAAKITEHPKVPEIEQVLSAGAAAQMIMTAAYAMNLGAIWRSGALMFEPSMRAGLGLDESHRLVGFIYLGSVKASKPTPEYQVNDFLSRW